VSTRRVESKTVERPRASHDRGLGERAVLQLQRLAGNQTVTRMIARDGPRPAVSPHSGPTIRVQRRVSYGWDWYSWGGLFWKEGAKPLWRRIDTAYNETFLSLYARLLDVHRAREVEALKVLIDFRLKYEGRELSMGEAEAFLALVATHTQTARDLLDARKAKPVPKGQVEEKPPSQEPKPLAQDEKPPLLEEKAELVEEKPELVEEKAKLVEEKAKLVEEKAKLVEEKAKRDEPLPKPEPLQTEPPKDKRPQNEPEEQTQEVEPADRSEKVEPKAEKVEPESPQVEVEPKPLVVHKPKVKTKPQTRKPSKQKRPSKTTKAESSEEETKPAKKPFPRFAQAGLLDAQVSESLKAFDAGVKEFESDYRPLTNKNLAEAKSALAVLGKFKDNIDGYTDTARTRRDELAAAFEDDSYDDEDLQAFSEASEALTLYEDSYRQCEKTQRSVDETIADLQGRIGLFEAGAAASEELTRLRRRWRTPALAVGHFINHRADTGYNTEVGYLTAAEALAINQKGQGAVLTKVRDDGDRVFWDRGSGAFACLSANDFIKTFFCPGRGISYYNDQA
jgi:hypothetical protein